MVASRRDFVVGDHPCEQELIPSFLTPRLVSGHRPCEFIHDADVYAAHPADLTREHAAAVASNGEEAWYFFTAVRSKTGGRKARTVDSGEGCWHSEAGSKPVVAARLGRVGHRQSFSFVTKENGKRVRSGWLMVELGLDDDGHDELTLCKVYFSQRAAKKKKPAAATPSPSASGRKRKAADENNDDASAPVRRARRLAPEVNSEAVDDDPVEEDDAPAGGGPDELNAKNSAPDEEPEVEDPTSFSCWLQNENSVMALVGMNSPGIVDEDENQASFSLWPRNESSMMALMGMNSPAPGVDDLDEEDPVSYTRWLWHGSGMMAALMGKNNEAAGSEQGSIAEAAVEGLPEIRYEAPAALPEWPPTRPPVVRDKDQPVYMWLTYDELYDLPEVKEFLKLDLQQLLQPPPLPPSVPVETDTEPDLQLQTLSLPPSAPGEAEIKPNLQPADG